MGSEAFRRPGQYLQATSNLFPRIPTCDGQLPHRTPPLVMTLLHRSVGSLFSTCRTDIQCRRAGVIHWVGSPESVLARSVHADRVIMSLGGRSHPDFIHFSNVL